MRQTTNYKLPSWDSEDRILRTDFNDLTEKVDTALAANAKAVSDEIAARESADTAETEARTGAVATLTKELAKKGNCRIYCTTYTGTGDETRTFTFPAKPQFVIIDADGMVIFATQGASKALAFTSADGYKLPVTWSSSSMTITRNTLHPNYASTVYHLIALIQVDA